MLKITAKSETGNVTTLFLKEEDIKQIIVHKGSEMVEKDGVQEEIFNNYQKLPGHYNTNF